jgi:hypothetical protein
MKPSTAALIAIMTMGLMGAPGMLEDVARPRRVKPNNKMPLTDEESETLAGLSGKAKKQYVKSLKEKYK